MGESPVYVMFRFRKVQHVLKRDPSKLGTMTYVCLLMGYPKGTKGYMFYDSQEQMVLVSTNARFLEEDYIINNKPRSKSF